MKYFKNINVIDVINSKCISNSSLTIDNDIIFNIGDDYPPEGAEIIDCDNIFAIPSYIDMHAHLTFDGRAHNHIPEFDYCEQDDISTLRVYQNLTEALLNGICAIRDVGGKESVSKQLIHQLSSNKFLNPLVIFCGEPFCIKNGHGIEFGIDHTTISNLEIYFKRHFANGFQWLKIMNGPELFEQERLNEIVKTAHQFGLKVAIHAFTKLGIIGALKSKADTIEHSIAIDNEMVQIAKSNNTLFIPTFYCSWLSLRKEFIKDIEKIELKYLENWFGLLNNNFEFHLKNKLPIATGTDSGSAPCTFGDIKSEIQMLHYKGMSPEESISAATIIPAKSLGISSKYGSIDVGKYANFILLKENPLIDIYALDNLLAVYYKGVNIFNDIIKPWY